jgi:hypothetical protein
MARIEPYNAHTLSTAAGRVWPEQLPEMHTPSQLQVDMWPEQLKCTPPRLQMDAHGQNRAIQCTHPVNCSWTCMARAAP